MLNFKYCIVAAFFWVSCTSSTKETTAITFPKIDRHPSMRHDYRWIQKAFKGVEAYNPKAEYKLGRYDLRFLDLRKYKLAGRDRELMRASFNSLTKWPINMPQRFSPTRIMELGKNPGLGIRALHKKGVDGNGIGIAIIDQPLIVQHKEYHSRIRLYEEYGVYKKIFAQMHGCAVASIAVGKNTGVAPGADLYYIAAPCYDFNIKKYDFRMTAAAIHRVLDINKKLPTSRSIRVIAIQVGWDKGQKGFQQMVKALSRAKSEGVFVVSSSLRQYTSFQFNGLDRLPYSDLDKPDSYTAGKFWARRFRIFNKQNQEKLSGRYLFVPMDSRTTADMTGRNDYAYYSDGGWSWAIPWIAGLYALACQVNPGITPGVFWKKAMLTGTYIKTKIYGTRYILGPIVNPKKLLEAIR